MTLAEDYITIAADAARSRRDPAALDEIINRFPVAVYVTDAQGTVTNFNRACIEMAGRVPVARQDRWCVTWKLYTPAGVPLPHDECPMAVAIREQRCIRGQEAIAERPDGSRVMFEPHPTPLFDEDGALIGAVNLLREVGGEREAAELRRQAARCRRLAGLIMDDETIGALNALAEEYESRVAQAGIADRAPRPIIAAC